MEPREARVVLILADISGYTKVHGGESAVGRARIPLELLSRQASRGRARSSAS
jgi:hypothetical protein